MRPPACIVVADQSEARVYLADSGAPLKLLLEERNPTARLHDRDLVSDRPGRVFDRAARAGARRGAVLHHATGGERKPRRQAAVAFARKVAAAATALCRENRCDRAILAAEPRFLGMLRRALPARFRSLIVTEVAKDWLHLPTAALRVRAASYLRRVPGRR
ncbi:MAG: host attachment protein [Gammaproteobacteria bacterium]